jgi:hypothetical protein
MMGAWYSSHSLNFKFVRGEEKERYVENFSQDLVDLKSMTFSTEVQHFIPTPPGSHKTKTCISANPLCLEVFLGWMFG